MNYCATCIMFKHCMKCIDIVQHFTNHTLSDRATTIPLWIAKLVLFLAVILHLCVYMYLKKAHPLAYVV